MLEWRGVLAPADSFMILMFLQLNFQVREKPPYETAWEKSPHDYEIYYTDALGDWPCNGESLATHPPALLCTQDRRLFVSVVPQIQGVDAYPEMGGKPVFKLPPTFFHEVAHMFLDPRNRESQPFLAEGRATARGERSLQIFKAAVAKAADPVSRKGSQEFFKGIGDPNYKGPDSATNARIDQIINAQPFSVFQMAAVCDVADTPPDAKYVMRQLEMPATFFNNQAPNERLHAYYAAWSLFHYGDEASGFEYGGDRLNTAIIRRVANLIAQNSPVDDQSLTALSGYLAKVQQLARADIKRKKISCPMRGSARINGKGG